MEFCDRCGALLILQEGKAVCANCNYKPKKKIKIESTEKVDSKESIAVIDEDKQNTYPIVQIACVKCDNKKAFFWTTQTRASDESETKFYKCTKCRHTWRVYR